MYIQGVHKGSSQKKTANSGFDCMSIRRKSPYPKNSPNGTTALSRCYPLISLIQIPLELLSLQCLHCVHLFC